MGYRAWFKRQLFREHGHNSLQSLNAEMRQEERLAKLSLESGSLPKAALMPTEHYTDRGNAITSVSEGPWKVSAEAQGEYRQHIGKSAEGYHGGLQRTDGNGSFRWSNARSTPEAARKASDGILASFTKTSQSENHSTADGTGERDPKQRKRSRSWDR